MSEDWQTYRNLRLESAVILRNPSTQETVTFLPGDDPPEWARKQMGPHVFGLKAPTPEIEWPDGKPGRIALVCNVKLRHRKPKPIAAFTVQEYLGERDGIPRFLWAEDRRDPELGTNADGSPVWLTPPSKGLDGKWHPGRPLTVAWSIRCCGQNLSTEWGWLRDRLDEARHSGGKTLDLMELIYTKTR